MHALLIAAAALHGAATGLLVPRAVHRLAVPPETPWRSTCPAGHPLTGAARGWLGPARCGPCALPYGPGVPAAAGGGALVCAGLAAAVGPRPELAVWLLLVPFLAVLALVDAAVHRLPDVLTLPLAAGAAALLGAASALPRGGGTWPGALLGGLALAGCYLVLHLIHPAGLGFGDVKLALALGIALGWYGWPVLVVGTFAGFLLGALYGIGLLLARRAHRRTAVPFGPFMICGALGGLVLGGLSAP
ncbi:prepilin peptidase [Streptomyces sp. URMC 123]|uniref:prepilin peptidase n=1 Tax=Streptomyces sp. URMC 123 TaxID=3423403 RepID=UPI003F1B53EA